MAFLEIKVRTETSAQEILQRLVFLEMARARVGLFKLQEYVFLIIGIGRLRENQTGCMFPVSWIFRCCIESDRMLV